MKICCSQCASINRVPEERLHDKPVCGKCGQSILPSVPVELTDGNFDKFISKTQLPILVDFWASWCAPCRNMAPEFADAAQQLSAQVIFAKLDTQASSATASKFSITGLPSLVLFKDGQEISRQTGAIRSPEIVAFALS